MLDRRTLLAWGAAAGPLAALGPRMAFAQGSGEKRLLVLVMRGATDGLSLAAPVADPAFRRLRDAWLDSYADAPKLDGTFRLHPSLGEVARMYADGDAMVAHAVATDYRERSHFDAQNLLESGASRPFERRDGFLNRLVGLANDGDMAAVALAPAMPLALRGENPATTYAPSNLPHASEGLLARLPALYGDDPQLAAMWQQAQELEGLADSSDMGSLRKASDAGTLAARMLREKDGARIAMLDVPGWDTHANQARMLERGFGKLDALLGAFRKGIGPVWKDTLVLAVTEFGRTAAINGTGGTDHGTASAALLMGGSVKGRRVLADWPGLAPSQLYEGRDLFPTTSLEALIAGALSEHFALDAGRVMKELFPGRSARPLEGIAA
ncbi:DUF1501 domain-containing protein [Qipengyuania sp. 1NDH17]|uniref:DUF1501 domain-containing protein n=1 Tax=Qipengyuania polymorpha TaxID=2867234 RepID=A0ABS7IVG2_9SPHN|nr:DUF1501 domain-containing protein [Qipengyuania polymorpha]MBX7456869.1 DUF1501 domain-containing protein [Qipengyuania polymorpha]